MGDASACGPGQEWDAGCTYNNIKGQCVPTGTVGKATGCSYPSSGGVLDFLGGLVKSAVNVYGGSKYAQGQASAYQGMQPAAGGTPAWVVPVALGGAAVVAVLLLKKRKKRK